MARQPSSNLVQPAEGLQFLKRTDLPQFDDEAKVDAIASLLAEVLSRNNLANTAVLGVQPRTAVRSVARRRARGAGPRLVDGVAATAASKGNP